MAGSFIQSLFSCPELPPPSSSSSSSGPTPSPTLSIFIAYALHRTRLHSSVTFAALFLLQRLKGRFPAARGSSGHRLFISAFMIASKVVCDDTYSNKSWCVVGQGMFSLREINQMEREMCGYLEWVLNVQNSELVEFEERVKKEFGGQVIKSSSIPASLPIHSTTPPRPLQPRVAREPSSVSYPTPESSPPSPTSPSHSNSTSPASSTCQTPEQPLSSSNGVVPTSNQKVPSLAGMSVAERSFAFGAPAVW
jgi:hypothetical protein